MFTFIQGCLSWLNVCVGFIFSVIYTIYIYSYYGAALFFLLKSSINSQWLVLTKIANLTAEWFIFKITYHDLSFASLCLLNINLLKSLSNFPQHAKN